jgi:H2-forming N5,N10-methylenetetrahydromethanopterin dehydrogenase-like enzyme
MRIEVSHIGATLAERYIQAGHDVAIANPRVPETLPRSWFDLSRCSRWWAWGRTVVRGLPG